MRALRFDVRHALARAFLKRALAKAAAAALAKAASTTAVSAPAEASAANTQAQAKISELMGGSASALTAAQVLSNTGKPDINGVMKTAGCVVRSGHPPRVLQTSQTI